jgi:two-component system, chemotaxis family, response regulator Rcp1
MKHITVMVIEDNPTDVFLVREALSAHGLKVDLNVFEDGEAAIAYVQHLDQDASLVRPSLVLLDVNLPRADGFTVLHCLRGSTKCGNIPVIIMTSSDALMDHKTATSLRADGYFQKPPGYDAFLTLGALAHQLLIEQL